ncbi:MAG TPA: hypothetical protein VFQ60_01635 [Patescibacteria group bacterium]|nr:hypothetical protein [Patescibacteria group bacterium]
MTYRGQRPRVVPITAPSFPTLPRPQIYRKIAYTFVALAVVVLVGVLWLSSVRADVTVQVKRTPVKLDAMVDVARAPRQGQIPGRVVQGVFEKIQNFTVSDLLAQLASSTPAVAVSTSTPIVTSTDLGVDDASVNAKGTVHIINKYSKAQTLVVKTRLLTSDNKLYRIDKTIVVPSGGQVDVTVHADQNGSIYAIGPTRFTIPGLFVDLQKYIYAVSDTPFVAVPEQAGSTVKPAPVPVKPVSSAPVLTADAIDLAQRQLTDIVLGEAKKTLQAEVQDPKLGEAVYFVKLLEKGNSVSAGQGADEFLASIKLDVTAVYYSKDDMLALVRSKVKERIPEGREFIPLDDSSVTYALQAADAKYETATIHVLADAAYRLNADSPALQKAVIAGKSKDDAIAILKAVDGVEDVKIDLKPSWVTKIPTLKDHINLTIQ